MKKSSHKISAKKKSSKKASSSFGKKQSRHQNEDDHLNSDSNQKTNSKQRKSKRFIKDSRKNEPSHLTNQNSDSKFKNKKDGSKNSTTIRPTSNEKNKNDFLRSTHEGLLKRHPDGFGFFIPADSSIPDVYIPRHSMTGLMTNDQVIIKIFPDRGNDRYRGEVVKVIKRGQQKIVGILTPLPNGGAIIKDEGKGWGQDLKIKPGQTLNAEKDQLVAVEILKFPDDTTSEFTGKVVQIIGRAEDPLSDISRVVHGLNIPEEFSSATKHEASKLTPEVSEKDIRSRKDLRRLPFITIDGATAKDFDDAILVETTDKGFRLLVAIADVSHYVRPGSAIDKDAYERGTSVYFPNFVIPMLPEILSNELCSLKPKVNRLAMVAEMQMDFTGMVTSSKFYEATIQSHARVTYGEAQEILDGNLDITFDCIEPEKVIENIQRAADLAKILMAKRFREGSLDLEIPETQLIIDSSGNPIDISRSERLFSHRLIEELMLAANVAVARFLAEKNIPAIYRIHEPPNQESIALLEKYLVNFGGRTQLGQGLLQKRLTKALQEFANKPEAQVLNILTLRAMNQAKYSANNLGHFGLGFDFYTHFTSPIRRYPDLIVHRLLKSQIMPGGAYKPMTEDDLQSSSTMLSACEQRAAKSERQIQAIKKARFMQKHLGEEFDGVVSSVAKFGIFVLLRQFEIDGLVHIDNLGKEKFTRFEFDEENLKLYSRKTGQSFGLGDVVKIRVDSADIIEGKIDFSLADNSVEDSEDSAELTHGTIRQKSDSSLDTSNRVFSKSDSNRQLNKKIENTEDDVLDLDRVPVKDHSLSFKQKNSSSEKFDPGKKLDEFLRRKGLRPTVGNERTEDSSDYDNDYRESRTRQGQRLTFVKPENRNREIPDEMIDRRQKFRRAEDRKNFQKQDSNRDDQEDFNDRHNKRKSSHKKSSSVQARHRRNRR